MYYDLTRPFMHLYPTCVDMISRPNSVCMHSEYDLWHHSVQMLHVCTDIFALVYVSTQVY